MTEVLEALLDLMSTLYEGRRTGRTGSPRGRSGEAPAIPAQIETLQRRANCAAAATVLNRVPFGLLILDSAFDVRFVNEAASRALDDGDPLVRAGTGVRPWLATDAARFESLIERTCRVQLCPPEETMIRLARRCSALPIGVVAIHLDAGLDGLAAVIMPDREREQMLRRALTTLFGFTPSETHIAMLMLQGHSIERAARQRGITRATANGHWQSARWKIGGCDRVFFDTLMAMIVLPVGGRTELASTRQPAESVRIPT